MFGDPFPETKIDTRDNFYKAAVFAQYTLKMLKDKLIFNTGVRFDHFSAIEKKNAVSPRFGMSFKVTPVTTISGSTGIYYQAPENIWLTTNPINKKLEYIKAIHYVAGIEHLFTPELRLSVEAYYKDYSKYPVSVKFPTYVLINGGAENGPNFVGEAASAGFGYIKGIDFSLHKKLTGNGFYGMINYSLAESRVTALEGGEKPGSFDYRHNLTIIAGYQITDDWLVGVKFRYTTGRPYTPFDIAASTYYGRGIANFDDFNGARYKDYNRLDLRVDKKWNFRKLSIVTYFELQNVFNTENVYNYFWNEYKNEQGTIYQWAFLPVGGFSIQF
jgi:outer membrane receptor for ferrienterochelin and colicin